jgi:hypothetical protein
MVPRKLPFSHIVCIDHELNPLPNSTMAYSASALSFLLEDLGKTVVGPIQFC